VDGAEHIVIACVPLAKGELPMNKIGLTAALLMISTTAFAQSAAETTGVNSLMGNAPKTEDFVTEAATSDMFEIASSKLAVEKADPATKTFAQQMIADHTKTSSEMKAMVDSGKVKAAIPAAMTSSQQSMIDKLNGLQGDDFNKQYHSDQVSAHKDAVDLFKRYGDGGDNADLKAWAATTRPALEHHLMMAKDLDK
jgi:putative membrane protein